MVEQLLTLAEVAELLRLPEATIYRQRYAGELPGSLGSRIGRHVRFRPSDLERFIDELAGAVGTSAGSIDHGD